MAEKIIEIRFSNAGKLYYYGAQNEIDIQGGDFAIVDTNRGLQLGEVIRVYDEYPPQENGSKWKKIIRKATPTDLLIRQQWIQKENEALTACREKAISLRISGVKIISAEYSYDGSHLTYFYSSESEEKINLNRLKESLQADDRKKKIEFRLIGPRDVAKIIGGCGVCGLEIRCCTKYLTDFSPISIKMAKGQGVSLAPSEITGMCGRLRCCLIYEYEQYVNARKTLPKQRKKVVTPLGEGKVVDVNALKRVVKVKLDDNVIREFDADEIEPWDEIEAIRRKSKECTHGAGGECC